MLFSAATFPDIHDTGARRNEGQHFLRHQSIMEHHIGGVESAHRLYSQKVRISRSSADEIHFSPAFCRWTSEQEFSFDVAEV